MPMPKPPPQHPMEVSEELKSARKEILHHLNAHPWKADSAERTALRRVGPDEIEIVPHAGQGYNRRTYIVRVNGVRFVLTENTPRPSENRPTVSSTHERRSYQQRLHDHQLPVATLIGPVFRLERTGHECELTHFVEGYHKPHGLSLNREELESYAQALAQMHLVCRDWAPEGAERSPEVTTTGLPAGFVHFDTHRGNLIFDQKTNRLKAVIDFEQARYEILANDIAQAVRTHFISLNIGDDMSVSTTILARDVVELCEKYEKLRPLSDSELKIICSSAAEDVGYELLHVNRIRGRPLTTDQMHRECEELKPVVRSRLASALSLS